MNKPSSLLRKVGLLFINNNAIDDQNASNQEQTETNSEQNNELTKNRSPKIKRQKGCTSSFRSVPREQPASSKQVELMAHIGFKYNPRINAVLKRIANDISMKGRGETIF